MSTRITEAMVEAMTEVAIDGPGYVSFYPSLHDCRRLLEVALSAEPGETEGWQPIESVPENTKVLVWTRSDITPDDIAYVDDFLDGEHILTTQMGEFSGNEWHGLHLIGEPICWRPLPAAPLPEDIATRQALESDNG